MRKGDVVIVEFPFTDLITTKLRPAVILLENRFDYVISFITSNLKIKEEHDMLLPATKINGLRADSLLKTNKVMTVDKQLVRGKIGQLTTTEMSMLNRNLTRLFDLK